MSEQPPHIDEHPETAVVPDSARDLDVGRERRAVLEYLQYQRASVRSIVDGLAEADWHRSVVPSRWTVAGMIAHLGDMERHWLQGVMAADPVEQRWDSILPETARGEPFRCDIASAQVRAYYQEQTDRADAIIATRALDDRPLGRHGHDDRADEASSLREILLHVIEETACHAGHLEIARELLDGTIGIGLR